MKLRPAALCIFFLLLLGSGFSLFCQDRRADTGNGTAADADAYLQEGSNLYYQGKYGDALYYFKLARDIDEELGYARLGNLGFDYGWIGEIYKMLGDYSKAEDNYRTARDLLNQSGQELYASLYTGNIGWLYKEREEWDRAYELLSEACETAEKFGEPYYISIWAGHLAEIDHARGEIEKAIEKNRRAYSIALEAGMDTQRYIVANNLGNQLLETGSAVEAERMYGEALELAERYGWPEEWGKQLQNLVTVNKEQRDYLEALKYARMAEEDLEGEYLNAIGDIYLLAEDYGQAESYFKPALEAARRIGDPGILSERLNNLGKTYSDWGKPDEALGYFEEALNVSRQAGDEDQTATCLNNIGSVYHFTGDYGKAVDYYEQALAIDERRGNMQDAAIGYNNIAGVYDAWGRYDDALEYLRKALNIAEEQDIPEDAATYYNNIGLVYLSWGDYARALDYIERALEIVEHMGLRREIGKYNSNIGLILMEQARYREALEYFLKAKEKSESLENDWDLAVDYNNIGTVYASLEDGDAAFRYYSMALDIARRLNQRDRETAYLNNIGKLKEEEGDVETAVRYYHDALAVAEETGRKSDMAVFLSNLGAAYFNLDNYGEAERYFIRTIDILEGLRLTAPGAVRREYLASQIHNYRWLVLTYLKRADPVEAFNTAELASAKYLAEQIGEGLGEQDLRFSGIEEFCASLDDYTAVVKIVELEPDRYIVLVGTKSATHGTEIFLNDFLIHAADVYGRDIGRQLDSLETRGVRIAGGDEIDVPASENAEIDFSELIRYYRYLLSKPVLRRSEREAFAFLSGELYGTFFSPFAEHLAGIERLIILPDGPLSLVPFEVLTTDDEIYMAERFEISYTQSLTVLELVESRSYSPGREALLGFGGAVYDQMSYDEEMVRSERQLEKIREETAVLVSRGGDTRGTYSALGIADWSNLPGSLTEIRAIAGLVSGSTVYTGADVTEERIKALSRSGGLTRYRQLHFATHGIVVPEIPELSAVVLSQFQSGKPADEDGYLTMKEIAGLRLETDFVNLSACETGLGKVYSGEGVVGLTQAFLVAGTKGISVSLWQVADEATMRFMTGFYGLIAGEGYGYSEALSEMKRRFIADERFSAPFFWAAFVYYGDSR